MKRLLISMAALVFSVSSISAQRLTDVRVEAQYITDKMAVELGLSNSQRNSVLSFNLAYLNGIASYRDINSKIWTNRNSRLKATLSASQWRRYVESSYFYRPIGWRNGAYVHNIYTKYPKKGCGKGYNKKHDKRCEKGHAQDRCFDRGPAPGSRFDKKPNRKGKGQKDKRREPPRPGRR